ncbi:MAG: response regulator [Campylobacterota bacterium]|nr:response regulator [Campylobacterota bacterium]
MSDKIKKLKYNANSLNLLLVEDEIKALDELRDILVNLFNKVDIASNGEMGLSEYLKYFDKTKLYYDIVITDIKMPKMDGFEFSRNILSHNPNQIIIVISATDSFDEIIDLINIGINYFIQKPFTKKDMADVLLKATKVANQDRLLEKKNGELNRLNLNLKSKVKEQTVSLEKQLYYDILTGLPKRNKLMEDMKTYNKIGILLNRYK